MSGFRECCFCPEAFILPGGSWVQHGLGAGPGGKVPEGPASGHSGPNLVPAHPRPPPFCQLQPPPAVCDSISFCAQSVPKNLSCTLRSGCLCPSNAIGLAGSVRSGQRCAQSLWAGGESARGQRQSQPQRHHEHTLPASVGPSHSPVPVSSSGPGSPAAPGDTGSCCGAGARSLFLTWADACLLSRTRPALPASASDTAQPEAGNRK